MPLIKVIRNGQVTLPASIRKVLQVVDGDYLEAEVSDGTLTLRPVAIVDREGAEKLSTLRRDLQIGIDQLDRGEGIPGEQVFERLRMRHKAGT
jgi:AbrB family looped-hinge helix DNA binding protein